MPTTDLSTEQIKPAAERNNKGISSMVPAGVRRFFRRNPTTVSNTETSVQSAINSNRSDHPNNLSSDLGEALNFHPDIEKGMKHILEEALVESIRTGNTAGIEVGIGNLTKAFEHAKNASGLNVEFTDEGKKYIPDKVRNICSQYLNDGVASVYSVLEYGVGGGLEHSIEKDPQRIRDLFKLGEEFGIPLKYEPPKDKLSPGDPKTISGIEQANKLAQEIIDRNLPKGLLSIIDTFGNQVSAGLMDQLPLSRERVNKWISIMQQRGWTVIDGLPDTQTKTGMELTGKTLSRQEVDQLIDEVIAKNLSKGANRLVEMVGYQIERGAGQPLSTWGSSEKIQLYATAAERYKLKIGSAVLDQNGKLNPDLYFDPVEIEQQIAAKIRENLPQGFEAITKWHLRNVKSGNVSQLQYYEQIMKEYIELANKYGVEINPDKLNRELKGHLTAENVQVGVNSLQESIMKALQKANYLSVSVDSRRVEELRQFVHEQGLDGKVNFSEIDEYLEKTGAQTPKLASG